MHALAFALALVSTAASPEAPATHELARGVRVLRGAFVPGQQPDGNTVLIASRQGTLVIDTGRHPEHVQRIVDAVRAGREPVVAIVNTHWHLDHVSGNPALRSIWPDAVVWGSDAIDDALTGFLAKYRAQLAAMVAKGGDAAQIAGWKREIARIDAGDALKPDRIVRRQVEMLIGGRPVLLGRERRAATAGDVWLYDDASRTLVAGDLVTLPVPFLDTACPEGWRRALARISALPFETLVPGHGAPMSRSGFDTWRQAYGNLLDCAARGGDASACVEGWSRDAAPLLAEADPGFVRGLADYYVTKVLRGDPMPILAACTAP